MRRHGLLAICAVFLLTSAGCFKKTTLASPKDDPKDQWSRGVWLYSSNCANCHGENGEGTEDVPAIAGPGALPRLPTGEDSERKASFDNAADLFAYVKETMPPLDTGCLTDDQLYAVTNYVLKQAEIPIPGDVGEHNAASIKLR